VATLPVDALKIIERFGPHRSGMTGVRLSTSAEPERLVKTHCCFCGQQCGVQLKVRGNEVIGFEPWEEFPFNRGMLCPKGVKRYLQGAHPDRLTTAIRRDPSSPHRFSPMPYHDAIARVASEIGRLQQAHGQAALGVLSGASLTTEKTYLMGKFARVCLRTPYIDYNGRLCMVSAGAANKKAFGIDRTTNPWSDMVGTEVVWVAGSNVAECSPITTNYLWQSREQGARIIVQDPRITPVARTCDLYLPVRPGRDAALFAGVLQQMIERDWLGSRVHRLFDGRLRRGRRLLPAVERGPHRRGDRRPGTIDPPGRRMVGHCQDQLSLSRARHRAPLQRRAERARHDQSRTGQRRIGKPKSGYGTITGQANGQGGREHGQKCDQLPGWRDIANPDHRRFIAGIWNVNEQDLPGPGVDAYELFRKIDAGEIKGLLSICFNPKVSLPDNAFITRCLEKLEFYVAIDFFLNDTARHADIVLPGSLQEEDEGTVTQVEGRVIKINKAIDPPGDAQQDWRIIQDIARAIGRPHGFTFANPREIFDELRRASKGGVADYSGITYEKIEQQMGVFWPCYSHDPASGTPIDHRGTPRLFERGSYNPVAKGTGPFYFPDGKARFNVAEYRPAVDDVSEEYPLFLTTGRVVSHFLSGTQTRRIGPLVDQYPEPRIEMHPRLAGKLGIGDGDWATVETRRGAITLRAMVVTTIRPDTIFIPYHWPDEKSANRLTVAAQDPISKIPQYKVCGCRVRPAGSAPTYAARLEPQQ
jgi:assimilatory nitrate reductase catalytic subunit